MANNALQTSQLIDRLWLKTQSGDLSWEQLSDRSNYQTRLGDYVISVSGVKGGLGGPVTNLLVKKLDGRTVIKASTGLANALSTYGTGEQDRLAPQAQDTLNRLFAHLSNRSTDIDELLRLIG